MNLIDKLLSWTLGVPYRATRPGRPLPKEWPDQHRWWPEEDDDER